MSEAGRIQFDKDAITPINGGDGAATAAGGVYPMRQRSIAPRSLASKRSQKSLDLERYDSDWTEGYDERDIKTKHEYTGWQLIWLAYQATGVIYGDIGTSPLYVYSSTFTADPKKDDLLGALSLIIWSLTLIVSVKYILIVLCADDAGEGGTFALYSLLSRHANIIQRDPREAGTIKMERVMTNELRPVGRSARRFLEKNRAMQILLKVLGVFGVALIMSDGVLTPAQSVLGAIQGIEVVHPNIGNATIVGVSCAILVLLFVAQPLGITRLASTFAPIVIIWLLFNLTFGIYNLAVFDYTVLKAFSPYFAGSYLVRNGREGWISLGGILLAFTGVEALFADLGAFSRRAVQLSWLCFAFPCLLMGYTGQAAYISTHSGAWSNPFYNSVPPGMFYPSLVIAILAAIVASQATITACFQLLTQIMKLSYFPQVKFYHTSKHFHGQVYIPFANWLLMIGTIVVTAAYNNTTKLGHAYGVCVILVTFLTTCMVAVVALIIWRIPAVIVFFLFLVFAALDGVFLSSALTKVPDGAWFTIALAIILSSIFILWRFGKEQQWKAEATDRFPPAHMIETDDEHNGLRLTPAFGGHPISTIQGMGIFFDKAGQSSTTPTVFIHFLQKFHAAPEVVVFFHLRPVHQPFVQPEDRYTITRCLSSTSFSTDGIKPVMPNCFRLVIRHGYMDEVVTKDLGRLVYEQIRNYMLREDVGNKSVAVNVSGSETSEKSSSGPATTTTVTTPNTTSQPPTPPTTSSPLTTLSSAFKSQTIYIVGKEQMRILPSGARSTETKQSLASRLRPGSWGRTIVLRVFLWLRENSRSKISSLNVEIERVVEVGFVKEI